MPIDGKVDAHGASHGFVALGGRPLVLYSGSDLGM